MSYLKTKWKDATLIGIDLETTGKYPLESEICEMAAVKWRGGQVIEEFQTLIRPTVPMSEAVIKIHNITNEMVASAPQIENQIEGFYKFIFDGVVVAHHAPFDMGFLAVEFERASLALPAKGALCSSLLSRKALPESPNHRLQTLIKHLKLEQGQAHRALDDARACLDVTLKCFEKIGPDATLEQIFSYQETNLGWDKYSMDHLRERKIFNTLLQALREKQMVNMTYQGGSRKGRPRKVLPIGVVRNPNGDFLVAREEGVPQVKRYFLDKITDISWSR